MTKASQAAVKESGSEDTIIRNDRNLATAGAAIGIIHINSNYPLIPGNSQNATTFHFPVRYQQVEGLTPADLMSGSKSGAAQVVQAAQKLEKTGVGAVIGACGSFINYQSVIADKLEIPVFSSILLTAPLLLSSLGRNRKLAIIFASADSFTSNAREQCGLGDNARLVIADCCELDAFQPILQNSNYLNSLELEAQLAELAAALVRDHPDIGAIMLQCSEFPPYAFRIQEVTGLPVYDITTLIRWVYSGLLRRPFPGTSRPEGHYFL